ncbi:unnamed protein product [Acanthosepion pharaonis]|uniref:Transmembrane protein n=1 Tax=Acanthosepion pharaonis TaxID=158019 RepID=A0A812CLZ8_ACAPH|nr:unnamed protein product [Sepia pharaonis]
MDSTEDYKKTRESFGVFSWATKAVVVGHQSAAVLGAVLLVCCRKVFVRKRRRSFQVCKKAFVFCVARICFSSPPAFSRTTPLEPSFVFQLCTYISFFFSLPLSLSSTPILNCYLSIYFYQLRFHRSLAPPPTLSLTLSLFLSSDLPPFLFDRFSQTTSQYKSYLNGHRPHKDHHGQNQR